MNRWRRLEQRPLLLALSLLGVLPALVELAAWARLFDLPYVRLERPLLTVPAAAITVWVALRLLGLSERIGPGRRRLIEAFAGASTWCAALSMVGLEVGRPLDRLTVVIAV